MAEVFRFLKELRRIIIGVVSAHKEWYLTVKAGMRISSTGNSCISGERAGSGRLIAKDCILGFTGISVSTNKELTRRISGRTW
ncbi:MAG: hypothetical protein ACLTZT_16160 [Butyricimonas faecalis]